MDERLGFALDRKRIATTKLACTECMDFDGCLESSASRDLLFLFTESSNVVDIGDWATNLELST